MCRQLARPKSCHVPRRTADAKGFSAAMRRWATEFTPSANGQLSTRSRGNRSHRARVSKRDARFFISPNWEANATILDDQHPGTHPVITRTSSPLSSKADADSIRCSRPGPVDTSVRIPAPARIYPVKAASHQVSPPCPRGARCGLVRQILGIGPVRRGGRRNSRSPSSGCQGER